MTSPVTKQLIIDLNKGMGIFMAEFHETDRVTVANRITKLLCLLNDGQSLNLNALACEYGVSKRTLQRDLSNLREVLPMLDLNQHGEYTLPQQKFGQLNLNDIRHFAMLMGVKDIFPNMDRHFLRHILDKNAIEVFETKGQFNEDVSQYGNLFEELRHAILNKYRVTIYYKGKYRLVDPYKLIHHRNCWYLAAVNDGLLKAYRLSFLSFLTVHDNQPCFECEEKFIEQLKNEQSIWFGEDKKEAVLQIHSDVADHFQKRTLLPDQQILKVLDDGSLLVSCRYVSDVQILSLIRYWIPHIRVVSPITLQNELINSLNHYLKNI